LVADGLAVAHSILRRTPIDERALKTTLDRIFSELPQAQQNVVRFRDAIISLLTAPDREEGRLLDALGAIAFNTSMLVVDPESIQWAESLSKRRIFMDASIVIPWMCDGHPLEPLYKKAIRALSGYRPCIASFYLNEVVSHRRLAQEQFIKGGFSERRRLEIATQFFGSTSMNAFISGYANRLSGNPDLKFDEYLEQVAPFESETGAQKFLSEKNIETVQEGQLYNPRLDNLLVLRGAIIDGLRRSGRSARNSIRIDHDAKMIGYIFRNRSMPNSPLLVTADRALLRCFARGQYADALRNVVLPHQAAYLSDLADTSHGRLSGLSRALWSARLDQTEHLRQFYTDRILSEYESLLVSEIDTIVTGIVDEFERLEQKMGAVDLDSTELIDLDRFESRFYELMAEAKKRKGLV
jgi:hypothetical protein